MINEKIKKVTRILLEEIGENPNREGLLNTPLRVAKLGIFYQVDIGKDVEKMINNAVFEEKYDQMVTVQDIEFFSMCEHHLLPFFGVAHVAYIPDGKIIGLSKYLEL